MGKDGIPGSHQETLRRQRASEIFTSIVTQGLVPATVQKEQGGQPLKSINDGVSKVCFALVIPQTNNPIVESNSDKVRIVDNNFRYDVFISPPSDPHETIADRVLRTALYASSPDDLLGISSVFPVIGERSGDYSIMTREVYQERAQNSLLVVIPFSQLKKGDYTEVNFGEILLTKAHPHIILVPEDLEASLARAMKEVAGDIVIRTVGTKVYQRIAFPNYEDALRDILRKRDEPLLIHGVRLPTTDDIEKMLS